MRSEMAANFPTSNSSSSSSSLDYGNANDMIAGGAYMTGADSSSATASGMGVWNDSVDYSLDSSSGPHYDGVALAGFGPSSGSMARRRRPQDEQRMAALAAVGVDDSMADRSSHAASHLAINNSDSKDAYEPQTSTRGVSSDGEDQGESATDAMGESSAAALESQAILNDLASPDVDTDIYSVVSNQRNASFQFFRNVVQTIAIVLAVNHSKYIDQNSNFISVITALWACSFLSTQMSYMLAHWTSSINIIKKELRKKEKPEQPATTGGTSSSSSSTAQIGANISKPTSPSYNAGGANATAETLEEQLAKQEAALVRQELMEARKRGILMQTLVRLGSSLQLFTLGNIGLSLLDMYITFLFARAIMDRIDPNFSDGIWTLYRIGMFLMLILPVMVEYLNNNYRQSAASDDTS
jgi:hypothetical protein